MVDSQDKVPLTTNGLLELKKEYQQLVEVKRPQVVEGLSLARKVGELTEDSEYAQAQEELAFIDGRISELEEVIDKAVLIDKGHSNCREIKLGCRVTLQADKKNQVFHLVGEWEANPIEAKISHQCPLGRSLLGKKIGDKVEVKAPVGKIIYTIVKID